MKKVIFNPYAKTKTTTSNDCDEYDAFCTVLSDNEYTAIEALVSARSADTMNRDEVGSFNLYYPETLSDELFNDQGEEKQRSFEEEQRSFEEELYGLGLQEVELPETTLTATQLNRNESKRCAWRRFLSNKTSYVITSYWSIRIGLWLQWLGRRQFSRRFRLRWIADTLSQAVTHFNAHISELNVELSETTKQLEEEKQQHQISKNSLKETQKERELLEERVTVLETSTRVDKGEIQELTDTNKNLKGQSQEIQDELLEEKRKHNETKDQLTEAKNKKDMFDFEYTEEYLPELVYLKENIESLQAAKGDVTQQLDTFRQERQEDHLNVSQELSEVKKLAKDGNLIRYENKYDGQHHDENWLFSFTDAILAKFRDCRFDDEPAPPIPFLLFHETLELQLKWSILSAKRDNTLRILVPLRPYISLS